MNHFDILLDLSTKLPKSIRDNLGSKIIKEFWIQTILQLIVLLWTEPSIDDQTLLREYSDPKRRYIWHVQQTVQWNFFDLKNPRFLIESGFKSRAGYNGARTVIENLAKISSFSQL